PEDRILETYIRNLFPPPSSLIELYLRDANFLHMAHMGRRRKLDPTLVSMLVERWRPETYKFHLPYGKCIIRHEDVQLQLGLSVGGPVVTRLVVTTDWRDVCEQLLGRVLDTIFRGRIDMNWLKRYFVGFNAKLSEVEREQQTRAYILRITGGLLMPDKSWNHRPSYVGQPEELEDIQLLLDQQSEADMPYFDSRTQACIPSEFLVNPNIWHVNVPLAVYTTMEMHKSDRIMRQF
ncbi:hypothetical protein Godav_027864, partial [Gossypium davidsonii]|nr:hypothetical protein [Gossypium davidsonii]